MGRRNKFGAFNDGEDWGKAPQRTLEHKEGKHDAQPHPDCLECTFPITFDEVSNG